MCLEFGSCFGGRMRDDYGGRARSRGGGYWSAPVPAPVYQQEQPPAVVHEAYHDRAEKADHTEAAGHATYLQDKAGSETPARHPAWHNKVADDAYTPRPHEAAAADHSHRDTSPMDNYHHHHPRQVLATSR
ncbi:unnamed protein product [Triticum turgidum subsp. durum]|uniref:Uncharacterized protein n=1 Tax=Triticum turgidum subsp. durum TaxID=4567 RepID=A0A9R1Q6S0_TRITD|nr:unnamed protein product [Triticum turgidum subsp. durum]